MIGLPPDVVAARRAGMRAALTRVLDCIGLDELLRLLLDVVCERGWHLTRAAAIELALVTALERVLLERAARDREGARG